jgi:hypothetical protein
VLQAGHERQAPAWVTPRGEIDVVSRIVTMPARQAAPEKAVEAAEMDSAPCAPGRHAWSGGDGGRGAILEGKGGDPGIIRQRIDSWVLIGCIADD